MKSSSPSPTTISEYIALQPEAVQPILTQLRAAIAEVAAGTTEKIGYGVPTYQLNGKNLVHFGAFKHHVSLFPGDQVLADFAEELKQYRVSKGTVQFPLDQPLPIPLIQKIVKAGVKRVLEKTKRV